MPPLVIAVIFLCLFCGTLWWVSTPKSERLDILGKHGPDAWIAKARFPVSLFLRKPFKIYPDGGDFRCEGGEPIDEMVVLGAITRWNRDQREHSNRKLFLERIKK